MKKLLYRLMILSCMVWMTGCERDMMDFEGRDAIYFDVQRGVAWTDSARWARYWFTEVNFINVQGDTLDISLKVGLGGRVTDYPRPFSIEVVRDSTTAIEGYDYDIRTDWEMPAGAACAYINMQVYKQEDLLDTNRTIMLKVLENEYFTTDLSFTGALEGRYDLLDGEKAFNPDPRFHTVNLKLEVSRPASWAGMDYPITAENPTPYEFGLFGAFTAKKYLLMLEVTGFTTEDFEGSLPSGVQNVISEVFANYLEEQFDKGEPVLEKDGRLMWCSKVTKWKSYQYTW